MHKIILLAIPAILLSGCSSAPKAIPAPVKRQQIERPAPAIPASLSARGLESVMGKDAATLKRMFGEPRLDVVEVNGRKLQFAGAACVLDTYLYPSSKGGVEQVAYVDARRSDGAEVDRAACVNALMRR